MPTLEDLKKNKPVKRERGELPYNFPIEVLDGNKANNYIQVVASDYGYDIVRRPSWLRDQKTRVLHIFNERIRQKYGVFPAGTNVCIAGWYEDEESCKKIIRSQRDHDHAVGLLEKARAAFKKKQLPAARAIVTAALTKEEGNTELLALKNVLIGEIALAEADQLLENAELEESENTKNALTEELAKSEKKKREKKESKNPVPVASSPEK